MTLPKYTRLSLVAVAVKVDSLLDAWHKPGPDIDLHDVIFDCPPKTPIYDALVLMASQVGANKVQRALLEIQNGRIS